MARVLSLQEIASNLKEWSFNITPSASQPYSSDATMGLTLNAYRRLAETIHQRMQQLHAEGIPIDRRILDRDPTRLVRDLDGEDPLCLGQRGGQRDDETGVEIAVRPAIEAKTDPRSDRIIDSRVAERTGHPDLAALNSGRIGPATPNDKSLAAE